MELISHSLTPALELDGIRSLKGGGNPVGTPSPVSALPPSVIMRGYT
jgi:hypothetical protein